MTNERSRNDKRDVLLLADMRDAVCFEVVVVSQQ